MRPSMIMLKELCRGECVGKACNLVSNPTIF